MKRRMSPRSTMRRRSFRSIICWMRRLYIPSASCTRNHKLSQYYRHIIIEQTTDFDGSRLKPGRAACVPHRTTKRRAGPQDSHHSHRHPRNSLKHVIFLVQTRLAGRQVLPLQQNTQARRGLVVGGSRQFTSFRWMRTNRPLVLAMPGPSPGLINV